MNKKTFEQVLPRVIWSFAVFVTVAAFSFTFSSKPSLAQSVPQGIYYVSPAASGTVIPASQTFTWNSVSGASEYWIALKKGALTLYERSTGSNPSVTISNIPQDGSTVTLQIWYRVGTTWYASATVPAKEVSYKVGGTGSTITSIFPSVGHRLSSSQNFTWGSVSGAAQYWVQLKRGTKIYYDKTNGLNTAVTLGGIPQDGQNVTLVIWYKVGTAWLSQEFVYGTEVSSASPDISSISPAINTSLSSTQTFTWSAVSGATEYWVQLKRGTKIYYDKTNSLSTAVTLGGIPQDGQNVTLVIWYKVGTAWLNQEFNYKTEGTGGAAITSVTPAANATIPASQTFTWSAVSGATEYWVTLKKGSVTLYGKSSGSNPSVTITNIPQDGSTLTFQIWYKMGSAWYTSSSVPAKEVSYVAGTVTGSGSITTVTPAANATIPASQTFTWNSVSGASEYWATLKKGSVTVYERSTGSNPSITISNIPQDGSSLTLQIWYKVGTTWYTSATVPAKQVTYVGGAGGGCVGCGSSGIVTVSPTPGTTLSQSTQEFNWNPVSGALEYWVTLKRGSTVIANKSTGSNPMIVISNIVHQQGSVLTLQIWYRIGSTWYISGAVPAKEVTYGSSPNGI